MSVAMREALEEIVKREKMNLVFEGKGPSRRRELSQTDNAEERTRFRKITESSALTTVTKCDSYRTTKVVPSLNYEADTGYRKTAVTVRRIIHEKYMIGRK